MKRALIIVDLQNDFVPGGALPVRNGNEVVSAVNRLIKQKGKLFEIVVATQDWHPAGHGSFASSHPGSKPGDVVELEGLSQVLWPDHCVQESYGAQFVPELEIMGVDSVFLKGADPSIDSYSGFQDNGGKKSTGLEAFLKEHNITDVYVLGLATDYCVKFTVLDALKCGFRTWLIEDCVRGVDLTPGDERRAKEEMKDKGVQIVQSSLLV